MSVCEAFTNDLLVIVMLTALLNPLFPTSIVCRDCRSTCHRSFISTIQQEIRIMEVARLASRLSNLQMSQHVAVFQHERSAVVAETVSSDHNGLERRAVGNSEGSVRIVAAIAFALREGILSDFEQLQMGQAVDCKAIHLAEAVISDNDLLEKHELAHIEETIGSLVARVAGNDHFAGGTVHFSDHVGDFTGNHQGSERVVHIYGEDKSQSELSIEANST